MKGGDNWELWKKWKVNGKLSTFDIYRIQRGEKERRPLHGDSIIGKFPFFQFDEFQFQCKQFARKMKWWFEKFLSAWQQRRWTFLYSIFPIFSSRSSGTTMRSLDLNCCTDDFFSTEFEQISTSTKANTSEREMRLFSEVNVKVFHGKWFVSWGAHERTISSLHFGTFLLSPSQRSDRRPDNEDRWTLFVWTEEESHHKTQPETREKFHFCGLANFSSWNQGFSGFSSSLTPISMTRVTKATLPMEERTEGKTEKT